MSYFELANGSTLDIDYYHIEKGFFENFVWDKSSTGEKTKGVIYLRDNNGNGDQKNSFQIAIRVFGNDAFFAEDIAKYCNAERKKNVTPSVFMAVPSRTNGYQKSTGKKSVCGNYDVKNNFICYNGKNPMVLDPKTKAIMFQGKDFVLNNA